MVDLDKTTHDNHGDLTTGKSVLQTVTEDEDNGETLTKLVRTGGGTGSPVTGKLGEHPVRGGMKPLQMFLGTTSHGEQTIEKKKQERKRVNKKGQRYYHTNYTE